MTTYRNVTKNGPAVAGEMSYDGETFWRFSADWTLLRVDTAIGRSDEAHDRIWALQDGYGFPGFTPEQGYDWSGIRDSTDEAKRAMGEVAAEYVTDADLYKMLGLEVPDADAVDSLRLIAAGNALKAEIEYDLEDRGLIRQTDQPYAEITPAGLALLEAGS